MIKNLINKIFDIETAYAHCDIPCGIYDPHHAQVAAFTVLRMVNLVNQLDKNAPDYAHKFARYTASKEEHAELCKHEVRVIWGDFFKPAVHGDNFSKANDLSHKIMLAGSKARQEVNEQAAKDLINLVNEFATVFWTAKNVKTAKIKAPFPVEGELVVPAT